MPNVTADYCQPLRDSDTCHSRHLDTIRSCAMSFRAGYYRINVTSYRRERRDRPGSEIRIPAWDWGVEPRDDARAGP